jgi:hypothetical protein
MNASAPEPQRHYITGAPEIQQVTEMCTGAFSRFEAPVSARSVENLDSHF